MKNKTPLIISLLLIFILCFSISVFGATTVTEDLDITSSENVTNTGDYYHLDISSDSPYDSLVLYMPFDADTDNTSFNDLSNNHYTASNDGYSYLNESGPMGKYATFDGGTGVWWGTFSGIRVPYNESFEPTTITVMSMFYSDNIYDYTDQGQGLVTKTQSGGWRLGFNYPPTGCYQKVSTYVQSEGSYTAICSPTLNQSQWYHTGFTYNGSVIILYLDGVEVARADKTGPITYSVDAPICIGDEAGAIGCDGGGQMIGGIDEVMVFNRSLTAEEFSDIYNQTSERFYSSGELVNSEIATPGLTNAINTTTDIYGQTGTDVKESISFYDEAWYLSEVKSIISEGTYSFSTPISSKFNINYELLSDSGSFNTPYISKNLTYSYAGADEIYPVFSNYIDNNGTLNYTGYATMSVDVINTNGTVSFDFNGTTYPTTNDGDTWSVSVPVTGWGDYEYTWHAYGSGILNNRVSSDTKDYYVNFGNSDFCAFHLAHTRYSDGLLYVDEYEQSIKDLGYGCFAPNDHGAFYSSGLTQLQWTDWNDRVNASNILYGDQLKGFFGFEWTNNAYGVYQHIATLTLDYPPDYKSSSWTTFNEISELSAWLEEYNGLGIYAHPTLAPYSTHWDNPAMLNNTMIRLVSIWNGYDGAESIGYGMWGEYECAENSGCENWTVRTGTPINDLYLRDALDMGNHLGFTSGKDDHSTYPISGFVSYTGVKDSATMSRAELLEQVRARHTWGANSRIWMDVTADNTTDEVTMGDVFDIPNDEITLDYKIVPPLERTISNVSIFKNGVIINFTEENVETLEKSITVPLTGEDTEDYIFVMVYLDDDTFAMSSPMYVTGLTDEEICISEGMTWTGTECLTDEEHCIDLGYTWTGTVCLTPEYECEEAGYTWSGTVCLTPQYVCENNGYIWTGSECMTDEEFCEYTGNVWSGTVCLTPQYICEEAGKYWTGSNCLTESEFCEYEGNVWNDETSLCEIAPADIKACRSMSEAVYDSFTLGVIAILILVAALIIGVLTFGFGGATEFDMASIGATITLVILSALMFIIGVIVYAKVSGAIC